MAKVKIPKKVAGVKIPKKVRKKARKAIKAVEGPMVREMATAAIGAVAGSAASRPGLTIRLGDDVQRTVAVDVERLAETVRNAALEGLRRFVEGFEEGMRDLSRERDGAEDEVEAEDADEAERGEPADDRAA